MENVSLQATSDPDTLYYHQVLREPDQHMFIEAMEHEIKQPMKIIFGYQSNDHRYHQRRAFYQAFGL
jgi:hypothetical protein